MLPNSSGAQGYLLLTLNDVQASLPSVLGEYDGPTKDQLALECVTLPIPASLTDYADDERDVWLVIRFGTNPGREIPISATQVVHHDRHARLFRFSSTLGGKEWMIKLPEPVSQLDREDQETFEVILNQYAAVKSVEEKRPTRERCLVSKYASLLIYSRFLFSSASTNYSISYHPDAPAFIQWFTGDFIYG